MLNVTPIRGNNQYAAAHYFSAADDYYAKENPGEWQGQGAQVLGLTGPVEQAQLAAAGRPAPERRAYPDDL